MDNTVEKFSKFSHMVMKEADEKKKEIITQAEKERQETIAYNEIQCLKRAYENIQDTVRKIDKDINEEVSKAIVESKQALFNRRDEIMNAVFQHVKEKCIAFKHQEGYKSYLEGLVKEGLSQVGQGIIHVLADQDDLGLLEEIRAQMGMPFQISESDEQLFGGCLVVNRTKGLMCDYSFASKLSEERSTFLEKYKMSIE